MVTNYNSVNYYGRYINYSMPNTPKKHVTSTIMDVTFFSAQIYEHFLSLLCAPQDLIQSDCSTPPEFSKVLLKRTRCNYHRQCEQGCKWQDNEGRMQTERQGEIGHPGQDNQR